MLGLNRRSAGFSATALSIKVISGVKMRSTIVLILALIVAGCTVQQVKHSTVEGPKKMKVYQNDKTGIDSIISNKALSSFQNEYSAASRNKAFAQSVSGVWSWKSNRTSKEHAITSALIGCQINNKKSEDIYPCEVIHVNDSWVK